MIEQARITGTIAGNRREARHIHFRDNWKDHLRRKILPEKGFEYLDSWQKRAVDCTLAMAALPLLPLGFVGALLVQTESPGDIFYRAQVMGKDGKLYKQVKFRTMKPDAQQRGPEIGKQECDDRVTGRWGRLLRRTSLDETPQFLWNVLLKGDMSVVGHRPMFQEKHSLCAESNVWLAKKWDNATNQAKPGFFGLTASWRGTLDEPYIGEGGLPRGWKKRMAAETRDAEQACLKRDVCLTVRSIYGCVFHNKAY